MLRTISDRKTPIIVYASESLASKFKIGYNNVRFNERKHEYLANLND